MSLPEFSLEGLLPPGIHAGVLKEVLARFAKKTRPRKKLGVQLAKVVKAALQYRTIKRVLVWGSFVTSKPEPNDLDYSLVVSVEHHRSEIAPSHARFLVPFEAAQFYGADRGYLLIIDYPLDLYIERLDFMCQRNRIPCGIVEISLRGEMKG
jgi:hypothetical protein